MNAEAKPPRINWYQATTEVLLIILGILGALAVDSWWDEKAEREAEIAYLELLRADFVANGKSLESAIKWEERLIGIGKDIHANIDSGLTQISSEQFVQKISEFYYFSGWEPITATYDELLGSGHLKYIQSHELRIMMAKYVAGVDDFIDYLGRQNNTWQLAHRPFLYEHIIISDFKWFGDYRPISPFNNHLSALESRTFWNLVSDWNVWHKHILSYYQRLLLAGEQITKLIDSELGNESK